MKSSIDGTLTKVGLFPDAILVLTVVNLSALIADSFLVLPNEVKKLVHAIDTAVCIVFFVDFLVQLYRADSKAAFLKWGWIDLIASIPILTSCGGDGLFAF